MRRCIVIIIALLLFGPAVASGQGRTSGGTQAQEAVAKADQAFAAKRFKEAVRLYNQALGYDRTMVAAYEKLAAAYYILRKHRRATVSLNACLQISPGNVKCTMWLGLHLLDLKQRKRGIQLLKEATKKEWKLPFAMRQLGFHYYEQQNWKKAEKALWSWLKFRPKSATALDIRVHYYLGRTYLALKRYPAAQSQFRAVLKRKPRFLGATLGLADAYLGRNYFYPALNLYLKLRRLAAKRPRIHLAMARCYYRMRRKNKALDHVNRYLATSARDPEAIMLKGDIYYYFREYGPALATYKKATQIAPNLLQAKTKYARALLSQKKAGKALRILLAARQQAANDPGLLLLLGQAYLAVKKPTEAVKILSKLLIIRPSNSQGYGFRGNAHFAANNVDQAIKDYEMALKLKKDNWRAKRGLIQALNRRAKKLLLKGQQNEAIADLNRAFTMDPQRLFTRINLAIAYMKAQKNAEALRHLSDVHQKIPRNFAVNRLLARLYHDTGKLQMARRHYEKARTMARKLASRFQAEVEIELGALLAAQQDIGSAVSVLKSAVATAAGDKQLSEIAQSNLAIALLDRGYQLLEKGKGKTALADLQLARSYVKLMKGNQPILLRFLLAMAYLDTGNWSQAGQAFRKLSGKRLLAKVLKPPFDRLGAQYFETYTNYRRGAYEAAATGMRRMLRRAHGALRGRIREIIRSAYELHASLLIRRGRLKAAQKALKQAKTYGISRVGQHNLAVALYRGGQRAQAVRIWSGGGMPAMAACNLGTHYDNAGDPQRAYQYYKQCRGGGRSIATRLKTIRRIFGYK